MRPICSGEKFSLDEEQEVSNKEKSRAAGRKKPSIGSRAIASVATHGVILSNRIQCHWLSPASVILILKGTKDFMKSA